MKTKILKGNLLLALTITINQQRIAERKLGYAGDSIFVAGLLEALEALHDNELEINYQE